ncbi:ribokinase [Saccharopolyspora phatthalungensis]|uniref:Ribokinase n=1 Tax=Saccharopolyspora phatthalungensis TaxID=664693 RepID=A0A840Q3B9_9PSEU|nr:ribokinase [Saccharopolyspora phatthalungensis]MBB5153199.1 ribokinase [Saccharopolyspora phatthalungensis]
MTTTVAVFGSCNMDLVAYVETAPKQGETVPGREFHTVPGGKGANQAIAAAKAGAAVRMIGAVGEDPFGTQIRETLQKSTVDVSGLRVVPRRSGTAHIVVDAEGGNSIVVVPGANATVDGLVEGDEDLIAGARSLLLQLEIPFSGVAAAAAAGRRNGVRVVLTPAPAVPLSADILSNVDLLVPNEHEAAILAGDADPRRALAALLQLVPEVVITLGARGSLYGNRDGARVEVPSFPVDAVDTTAAGDTFVGVLSTALGEGAEVPEALRLASAGAAVSVQRNGASSSMPTRQEIIDFVATR